MEMEKEPVDKNLPFKVFKKSNDDLYNLSVRKKAVMLCRRIICETETLDRLYDEKQLFPQYREELGQIGKIVSQIMHTLIIKGMPAEDDTVVCEKDKFSAVRLLTDTAYDLASLAALVNIRNVEKELVLCVQVISAQLKYHSDKTLK